MYLNLSHEAVKRLLDYAMTTWERNTSGYCVFTGNYGNIESERKMIEEDIAMLKEFLEIC